MNKKVIVIILVCIVYFYTSTNEYKANIKKKTSLTVEGYIVNPKNPLKELPEGYEFVNYRYTIKGCTLSTFHRDVTSSAYEFKTNHPVYTYIEYFTKGALISVCPGSHKTVPLLYSNPEIIYSENEKTSILFNSDIVHAGVINEETTNERYAIQYKIVHKDDLKKFPKLVGIDKVKEGNCDVTRNTGWEIVLRRMSLFNSFLINHVFTKYLQENQHNILNKIALKLTNKDFYNV
jgi:hypothetical protein